MRTKVSWTEKEEEILRDALKHSRRGMLTEEMIAGIYLKIGGRHTEQGIISRAKLIRK